MTLDEQHEVLKHWESAYGKMDDVCREQCIDDITTLNWTKEQWMDYLYPVPDRVFERYCKMLLMLLEKKLIDQEQYDETKALATRMSPVDLAKSGKKLMNWYRREEQCGFTEFYMTP